MYVMSVEKGQATISMLPEDMQALLYLIDSVVDRVAEQGKPTDMYELHIMAIGAALQAAVIACEVQIPREPTGSIAADIIQGRIPYAKKESDHGQGN